MTCLFKHQLLQSASSSQIYMYIQVQMDKAWERESGLHSAVVLQQKNKREHKNAPFSIFSAF